jgi:hypothetical protein
MKVERLKLVVFNAQLALNCLIFGRTRKCAVSAKSNRTSYMNRTIMIGDRLHGLFGANIAED